MTVDEIKQKIVSVQSLDREIERLRIEIEQKRQELISIQSSMNGGDRVMSSAKLSMPERVYFQLEELYIQLSELLQSLYASRQEVEEMIGRLDPIEQEIVRAWTVGRTEEQIGEQVGYSSRNIRRIKRRILIRLADDKTCPPMS